MTEAPSDRREGSNAEPPKSTSSRSPPIISADALLGRSGILHIEHRGELYQLRITRQGKLILTK